MTPSTALTRTAFPPGPAAGLAVQVALLGLLAATHGLSRTGLAAALAYAVLLAVLLTAGLRRSGTRATGPANLVTLGRAVLVGGVTALVVTSFTAPVSVPLLAGAAAVALALDGVDGQVARRTGTVTALGARFDMEVDSVLALVLSVYAAHRFGWWILAIGVFRYAFLVATWLAPWLGGTLPPRFSRKVVAAAQGVVLVADTAGVLPRGAAVAVTALALAWLVWSFGTDVGWLHRSARVRRAAWLRRAARRRLAPAR